MLEEVGVAKLSMRALCGALGVTATAAYHHFTNRAELLAQLATQGYLELAEALNEKAVALPVEEKIRGFCLIYLNFARRNPALYQLMFGPELEFEQMPEHLLKARQFAFSRLELMVADLLKQTPDSPDVRSAALASWSYIHGLTSLLLHEVLQRPAQMSDQRIIERTLAGFEILFKAYAASIKPA
jgi:AcrR family transcriptional regulator